MKVLGVYYFFVMMLLDLGVLNEKMKSFEIAIFTITDEIFGSLYSNFV